MSRIPQYWLWVTGKDYYAEADGSDRVDLDPSQQADAGGWWTCHKNTRAGDRVLLYRKSPRMDIAYLIEAMSDSYSITGDPYARDHGWDYGCEYRVVRKLKRPVTLAELRGDPGLRDWGALRANFRGRAHAIPERTWARLLAIIKRGNPGPEPSPDPSGKITEKELEDRIVADPSVLAPFGLAVKSFDRQVYCRGYGGLIDLIGFDGKGRRTVVIELKVVRASRNTYAQIASYLGWVESQPEYRKPVAGLVIADGFDAGFMHAVGRDRHVSILELSDVLKHL